jgi:hypothetical protein
MLLVDEILTFILLQQLRCLEIRLGDLPEGDLNRGLDRKHSVVCKREGAGCPVRLGNVLEGGLDEGVDMKRSEMEHVLCSAAETEKVYRDFLQLYNSAPGASDILEPSINE